MDHLWRDLRFTLRTLSKEPGFAAVAIVTLALGIGASSAIFGMIDSVLLEPLPYEDPEHLMAVFGRGTVPMTPELFLELRDTSQSTAGMAALDTVDFNLVDENGPLRATGAMVTANFFELFGVRPVVGRAFSPEEGEPGRNDVALISYDLWQGRFGGRRDVVGRELKMYWTSIYGPERRIGHSITVIGVLPRDFISPRWPRDVWVPLAFGASEAELRANYLFPYARLAPGSEREAAAAEMRRIYRAVSPDEPDDPENAIRLVPMPEVVVQQVRPALLAVTGAVAFVLLIACVNVAHLLLARAAVREREIAVRRALGASRGRLVRQLLVESLLLAFLGSVLGLAVARGGVAVLEAWQANAVPRLPEITIGTDVLAFTAVLTCLSALLFGLVPAFRASSPSLVAALRDGGGGAVGSRSRLRRGLVVAEVALAVVLLVGAGLLLRSFQRLIDVDLGFEGERVLAFGVSLPRLTYGEPTRRQAFFSDAVAGLEALPDVESAAAVSTLPFSFVNVARDFDVEGRPAPEDESRWANYRLASAGFFRTLGIPVLAGEAFRPEDVRADPSVVVVSRSMARRYWGEGSPIGSRLKINDFEEPLRVIGVVGDVRLYAQGDVTPTMYVPCLAGPVMGFVVRGRGEPEALVDVARRTIRALDPEQPIYEARALDSIGMSRLSRPRYNALLVSLFATLALVLAAVGIYGVLSFSVSRRTREMGLRRAIGARRRDVLRLVVGQGLRLVLVGLGLGLVASLALTRFLESLLFGVEPTDPATFVAISAVLVAVALAAICVPAWRATRVEPVTALRHE